MVLLTGVWETGPPLYVWVCMESLIFYVGGSGHPIAAVQSGDKRLEILPDRPKCRPRVSVSPVWMCRGAAMQAAVPEAALIRSSPFETIENRYLPACSSSSL